jgi:BirA family transcriptional regulator, biotin operon repressor / biotin---[acetyl-CoA-carboxylase] ligase
MTPARESATPVLHNPPGYRLIEFGQLHSTNAFVLEHIDALAHCDVISAGIQTAGRGRLSRAWVSSQPENAYLSVVLKPPHEQAASLAAVTHFLAVVVCHALEAEGLAPAIKWPNDVQVSGRKVAGILAEARLTGAMLRGMALGLGVNLNLPEAVVAAIDQPATALNLLLGRHIDRGLFLRGLLDRFFGGLDRFLETGFEGVRAGYEQRASFLGRRLTVRQMQVEWTGVARGLDPCGALELECADGTVCRIQAGDLVTERGA